MILFQSNVSGRRKRKKISVSKDYGVGAKFQFLRMIEHVIVPMRVLIQGPPGSYCKKKL